MFMVSLRNIIPILEVLKEPILVADATEFCSVIDKGIRDHGIVNHKDYGKVFAYEVDGFGSHYVMDDPNIPSLLSLPYVQYCSSTDEVYKNTRSMILGPGNPFYAKGKILEGLTSPHTGVLTHMWPMATIMQALTSDDEAEIMMCLQTLKKCHAGTYFMHESVHVDKPKDYTRPWFCWVNSLFGELILMIEEKYPEILTNELE